VKENPGMILNDEYTGKPVDDPSSTNSKYAFPMISIG
jgi:hypothetical protein